VYIGNNKKKIIIARIKEKKEVLLPDSIVNEMQMTIVIIDNNVTLF